MSPSIEERLASLEVEVARLKGRQMADGETPAPWWELRWGAFKDDGMYEEARRLGAEYRKSQPTPGDDDVSP